jgi:hypothetical protein
MNITLKGRRGIPLTIVSGMLQGVVCGMRKKDRRACEARQDEEGRGSPRRLVEHLPSSRVAVWSRADEVRQGKH